MYSRNERNRNQASPEPRRENEERTSEFLVFDEALGTIASRESVCLGGDADTRIGNESRCFSMEEGERERPSFSPSFHFLAPFRVFYSNYSPYTPAPPKEDSPLAQRCLCVSAPHCPLSDAWRHTLPGARTTWRLANSDPKVTKLRLFGSPLSFASGQTIWGCLQEMGGAMRSKDRMQVYEFE